MVTDYWAEIMQDVCYLIAADGWKAETYRVIETDKKGKEKDKGWTCEARNGYARAHRLVRLVRAPLAAIFLSAWVPSAKMRVRMAIPTLADAILDWSARYVQAYPCGRKKCEALRNFTRPRSPPGRDGGAPACQECRRGVRW